MKSLLFVIAVTFSSMCFANWNPADEDLENCRWRDGRAMSEKNCTEFRAEVANEQAAQKRQAEYLEQSRLESAKREAEKAKQDAILEEQRRIRIEETKREHDAFIKSMQEGYERDRELERKALKAENEKKAKCGLDYKQPRIGMTLIRAQECVGKFRLSAQINRADGIVSTYEAGNMYLHVMSGNIVSWGRY